jgi:hypothetical protein
VVWLVSGNVTINGTVSLDGQTAGTTRRNLLSLVPAAFGEDKATSRLVLCTARASELAAAQVATGAWGAVMERSARVQARLLTEIPQLSP